MSARKSSQYPPTYANCPHCRGVDTLVRTDETHTDSNGVECAVWRCLSCTYEEGRPVEARD